MTFARYYKLAVRVVAAGFEILNLDGEGLRIAFEVLRSTAQQPDFCKVVVWGLSLERRIAIRELHRLTGALPLQVFAGWDRIPLRLFSGTGTNVVVDTSRSGADHRVEVVAGDGADGYSAAVLEFSTYAITPLELVQLYAAPALTTPIPGQPAQLFPSASVMLSPTAVATLSAAGAATVGTYVQGYAFSGSGRELLDEVCRTIGAKWWISDGVLEVVPAGAALPGGALALGPTTGLLDHSAPEGLGEIECDALLDGRALPGRLVVVTDDFGAPVGEPAYRIESARFTGDTGTGLGRMKISASSKGLVIL